MHVWGGLERLLRGSAPCLAWEEASGLPDRRKHTGSTGWSMTHTDCAEGQQRFCDGHQEFLLWVIQRPPIQRLARVISSQSSRWATSTNKLPHSSTRRIFSIWITEGLGILPGTD